MSIKEKKNWYNRKQNLFRPIGDHTCIIQVILHDEIVFL